MHNHKDLQLEEKKLSKKFDKKKELTESDYRYFIDRSFGQFHPPYTDDNEDGYRFTHTDCNEDHAFNLFLKHNKLSLKKKSVKIVNR